MRWFGSERALWQHERTSSFHHFCDACDRDFISDASLKQHYINSSRHVYCTLCEELIDHLGISLGEHYEESHYECPGCNLVSGTHMHQSSPNDGMLTLILTGLHE